MTPCPTPHKHKWRSRRLAEEALGRLWCTARCKRMPIRVYKCECGQWHHTKLPLGRS